MTLDTAMTATTNTGLNSNIKS